ncbi:MAG: rane protein [Frankiales bacterium]|nr:rane protein [Frankiales bacterium]
MNLLRRKATASTTSPAADFEVLEPNVAGKKGRPTPKRRRAAAPPPPAPKTRKEAMAWQKQQGARAKVAGQKKMSTAEYREAMKAGDPRVLPRRDAGPMRALARDYVDSRRMASNFLLLLLPLLLVGYLIKPLQLVTLGLFVLLLIEWMITGTRLRKLAQERGLETKESAVSLGFYAGSRAYFPRSWRRPVPRVNLGDKI